MTINRKFLATIAMGVACVGAARANDNSALKVPQRPEAGAPANTPMPPLGNVSGIGKASGGVAPGRMETSMRSARTAAGDVLRGDANTAVPDKFARSVVLIVTPTQLGSGTIIDRDGTIITSWHIVGDLRQVGVIFKPADDARPAESDAVQAQVTVVDPAADLALVKIARTPPDIVPVMIASPKALAMGTAVRVIGHPYGENWSYTDGTITAMKPAFRWVGADKTLHKADIIKVKTPVITGNDGGPILDRQGRLLGVDAFNSKDETLVSIAVSVTRIQRLVEKSRSVRATRQKAGHADCEPVRLDTRRTRNETATMHSLDLNCNGKEDAVMLVPDDRRQPNSLINDANENGITDSIYLDNERDGKFDEVRFDSDEDGNVDLIGNDLDDRLLPQRLRILSR